MEHVQFFFAIGTWWLIAIVVLGAFGLAWMTYSRTQPPLSMRSRLGLRLLRFIGLTCLALALFEPVLRFVLSEERSPRVLIAIDESRSMSLTDGQGARHKHRSDAVARLRERAPSTWDFAGFAGGVEVREASDTFALTGERTDLAQVLRWSANRAEDERPALVLFVTDGQINTGASPIGEAIASGMGIYSVGIGDTVRPVDASLTGLLLPGVAVVNDNTPVNVVVASQGLEGVTATILLLEENSVVDQDTIVLPGNGLRSTVEMEWTPRVAGHRKLTARIVIEGKEATTANNTLQQYVDVRKAKRTVYVVAGAPSSDVSFVLRALERIPNMEVKSSIQKQDSEYYDHPPTAAEIAQAELCILIGFPRATTPSSAIEQVASALQRGTGLLFIPSREVDYGRLGAVGTYLPFSVAASRPAEFRVTPDVQRGATADPILKVTGTESDNELWNTLPPIYRTETFVTPRPGATVLATVKVNNVPLAEPLIIKRDHDQRRSLAILGYGIYRWELLSEGPAASRGEQPVELFSTLIGNATSWLSVRDDERRVRIAPTREFYGAGESVIFQATVLDASMAPVEQADVRVRISGASVKDLALAPIGSGRYRGSAGALPPGEYTFTGTATADGSEIGTDKGRFSVSNLLLEDAALTMNIDVLKGLAQASGGSMGTMSDLDSLIDRMEADPRLRVTATTHERDTTLWHTIWPLLVALTAFSLEWFWRKRRGLV